MRELCLKVSIRADCREVLRMKKNQCSLVFRRIRTALGKLIIMVIGRAIDGNSGGILNERFFMFPCHPDRSKEHGYAGARKRPIFYRFLYPIHKISRKYRYLMCRFCMLNKLSHDILFSCSSCGERTIHSKIFAVE